MSSESQPEYIRCVHNERRGLLISSPPRCICEYCNQTWIYGTPAPVCSVLKAVYDATQASQIEFIRNSRDIDTEAMFCEFCHMMLEDADQECACLIIANKLQDQPSTKENE